MSFLTNKKFFVTGGTGSLGKALVARLLKVNAIPIVYSRDEGKQALNFQISLLLYSIIIGIFTIPFFIGIIPEIFHLGNFNFANLNEFNGLNFDFDFHPFQLGKLLWPLGIAGAAQLGLFLVNIVYTILATIRTSEGIEFKYPISIPFIK